MSTSVRVRIDNVRLSFPALFKAEPGPIGADGKPGKPKFKANFLFEIGSEVHVKILDAMKKAAVGEWGDKGVAIYEGLLKQDNKICLHNGDTKPWQGYEGMWYVAAKSDTKPVVRNRQRDDLITEEREDLIYAGCYVNAMVSLYAHKHSSSGHRIDCGFDSVQLAGDGDSFATVKRSPEDFDNIADTGDGA